MCKKKVYKEGKKKKTVPSTENEEENGKEEETKNRRSLKGTRQTHLSLKSHVYELA